MDFKAFTLLRFGKHMQNPISHLKFQFCLLEIQAFYRKFLRALARLWEAQRASARLADLGRVVGHSRPGGL